MKAVFGDGKVFVDAVAQREPAQIMREWMQLSDSERSDPEAIRSFVTSRFSLPGEQGDVVRARAGQDVHSYITDLWQTLQRVDGPQRANGSLIALPKPYIVPGGRFRELYYWDSYFTMLGLAGAGRFDDIRNMVDNFDFLIKTFGHIPNGTRSYYLSRSQPPFFGLMVELLAEHDGQAVYNRYRDSLIAEHDYWMSGSGGGASAAGPAARAHVVTFPGGGVLNRYWDASDAPRDESYREDVETGERAAATLGRDPREVHRDVRAAAESGWDFSSRWLADPTNFLTIRTTELVPVDLNALLYRLELTIERAYRVAGDRDAAQRYSEQARARRAAMQLYLRTGDGWYSDYDWKAQRATDVLSPASLFPAFLGVDLGPISEQTLQRVKSELVSDVGISTTTFRSGQQWDAPNSWAPLQIVSLRAAEQLGDDDFAHDIARRFSAAVQASYDKDGFLYEKYVSGGDQSAAGGEYENQKGFGWTNGTMAFLMDDQCRRASACVNGVGG